MSQIYHGYTLNSIREDTAWSEREIDLFKDFVDKLPNKGAAHCAVSRHGHSQLITESGEDALVTLGNSGNLTVDGSEFITDSHRLVIGHTAGISTAQSNSLQVMGTVDYDSRMTIGRFSDDEYAPGIEFLKSRSTTIGGSGVDGTSDELGQLLFRVDDGNDFDSIAAQIRVTSDGSNSENSTPGKIHLRTTASGSNSPTTAITIDSNQDALFDGAIMLGDRIVLQDKTAVGAGGTSGSPTEQSVADGCYFTIEVSGASDEYYRFTNPIDGQIIEVTVLDSSGAGSPYFDKDPTGGSPDWTINYGGNMYIYNSDDALWETL